MKKQHHVIYVPGIGDDMYRVQSLLIKLWRMYGVRGHCHEMPWQGDEAFEPKLQRLLGRIDGYADAGHKVSLIGASAGASAVLHAYLERKDKISGVVYLVAKINGPETVGAKIYRKNPAFKTALYSLQTRLTTLTTRDKARLLSAYSTRDQTVPYEATVIADVQEKRLPSLRHAQTILYCLSFGAHGIIKHLKRLG